MTTTRPEEPTHVVPPVRTSRLEALIQRAGDQPAHPHRPAGRRDTTSEQPDFLFSADGWRELLRQPTILILVAVGEAMVIVTRNVDLSVGSVLGLATYFAGWLFHNVDGIPIVVVVAAAVLLGAVLGLFNGVLVALLNVPALVITLGHALRLSRHRRAVDRRRLHPLVLAADGTSRRWACRRCSPSRCS